MNKLLLLLFFSVPLLVQAQHDDRREPSPPMERLESFKKVRMLEELKLDEQTGVRLISKYTAHREAVKALEDSRFELIKKLEEKINSDAPDVEYQKIFTQLADIEKNIADSKIKFIGDLKEILTTKQIAQYLVFEMKFARDIRDILREGRKRERPRD
jgi:hypothetical protein